MAEAITFFIESAHLMRVSATLMYLSVDSTIVTVWPNLESRAHKSSSKAGSARREHALVGPISTAQHLKREGALGPISRCPRLNLERIKAAQKPDPRVNTRWLVASEPERCHERGGALGSIYLDRTKSGTKARVARRDRALVRSI